MAQYVPKTLKSIEAMHETSFDEIVLKYIEMNIADPFMEGNGRSTRIWLDLMLKRSLKRCINWSKIDKHSYLKAKEVSVTDPKPITDLLSEALTDQIDSRALYRKGIAYSY